MTRRSLLPIFTMIGLLGLVGCGGGNDDVAIETEVKEPTARDETPRGEDSTSSEPSSTAPASTTTTRKQPRVDFSSEVDRLSDAFRDASLEFHLQLVRDIPDDDLAAILSVTKKWRLALLRFGEELAALSAPATAQALVSDVLIAVDAEAAEFGQELAATSIDEFEALGPAARAVAFRRVTTINALRVEVGLSPLGASRSGKARSAKGTVVLTDDFSDPASGWDVFEEPKSAGRYEAGAYRLVIHDSDWKEWLFGSEDSLVDTSVELDVRKSAPPIAGMGAVCRVGEERTRYEAGFDIDGWWYLARVVDDDFIDLNEVTGETNAAEFLAAGDEVNHLRFDCVGPAGGPTTLTLYLNGMRIATAVDPAGLGPGAAGFVAGSVGEAEVVVNFDNMVVRSIP